VNDAGSEHIEHATASDMRPLASPKIAFNFLKICLAVRDAGDGAADPFLSINAWANRASFKPCLAGA
jgi:hypothetical protein